ncbi:MarR family transcriptional regulator [Streptomyces sp. BE147]|uniref:MarR family winged helix-turn-helix transcriptional regulator n=1 Tax=unclassified Streptomyces TaxID=2593676 RepID=UPI002E7A1FCF|nr:MarR family transcriptional regulator [Streptomyces sp. BE147]MEE1741514.1 MarR family transcriptional regulator [Streptomyces sp. BE147]
MSQSPDLDAWAGLSLAYHDVSEQLDSTLRQRHELCISWFEVLAQLADRPLGIRVSELTSKVTLSQPRVSRIVLALEDRGLAVRNSAPNDARGTEVQITAAGREVFAQARLTSEKVLRNALLGRLTEGQTDTLRSLGAILRGPGPEVTGANRAARSED